MKLLGIVVSGILFFASLCYAQQASSAAVPGAAAIAHGAFPVKVTKTLDSSKLKEGDSFELETAGTFKLADGTLVPKGSKLQGHITASKSRAKGDAESALTLAFDKLNISNGKQLSLKGSVQSVFPPAEESMGPNMANAGTSQGGSVGGSTVGGGGVSSGGIGLTDAKNGSSTESSASQPTMNPQSVGVQGIHDLSLTDGVLTSKGKNVKLGNGVRMIVAAEILGYSPQT